MHITKLSVNWLWWWNILTFLSKYTHCIAPLYFVICSALLLGKSIAFVHQKKLFSSTDTLPNGSLSLWNSLEFQTNSIAQKCVGKKNKKFVWRCPNSNWPFKKVVRMAVRVDPHPPLIYTAIIFWKSLGKIGFHLSNCWRQ